VRAAFSYFSTLPVGATAAPGTRTLVYLPLVGATVGALAGTLGWLVSLVGPHVLVVAVTFGSSIALTGALHVDGFLDASDALFASVSPQRRLEIFDDPHHGTFAIAAFAVATVVWLAALWSIDAPRLPLGLAFAAAAARWITVSVSRRLPYAGTTVAPERAGETRSTRGVHVAMGMLTLLLGWSYWGHAVLLVALGGLTFATAAWMKDRLGGALTGDCYGFLIVATEVAILVGLPFTSR
jgi:cobalamin synthase